MPCYSPLQAFQDVETKVVAFKETPNTRPLTLPCGRCSGCRLEHSRQWAMRCTLESQLHRQNCFVTLTYDDDHMPMDGTLHKPHLTKFFKRLRKNIGPFRYYACGEYGDRTQRAHYHACIFGLDFHDKIVAEEHDGIRTYFSPTLTKIWGMGHCTVGEVNFKTAAYTARYVMKKRFGEKGGGYVKLDETTGEISPLQQPYAVMSLRPAIGLNWLHKFHKDIYNVRKDYLMMNGSKMKPPKYFDKVFSEINPERMEEIKLKRYTDSNGKTDDELRAHAAIARARTITRKKV